MSDPDDAPILGRLRVMVTVYTNSETTLATASETLGRAAAGLALDGIEVDVTIGPTEKPS